MQLAKRGRIPEGEAHLDATKRLFEAEGLDHTAMLKAWRIARAQVATPEPAIASVAASPPSPQSSMTGDPQRAASPRRASIAIMPFADRTGAQGGPAAGLVHDVISRLAKLRSLFVIAQGTVFALHDRHIDPGSAARTLDVDYIVTGTMQCEGANLTVAVELTETRTARIIWAEVFSRRFTDAFVVLDEIGNRIVASVASEIETVERNRAILKPPSSLDAWEAFHRGLWHMYRFEKDDNARARHFFEMAVRLDPTFARAHAGLSFTHWQNAFQGWAPREQETDRALEAAGQSLMADDRDPSAHWAMGRAMWLRGEQDQAVGELETAVDLSPNFALGHYTLAFVNAQMGDPNAAIGSSDHSRHLSPFDPMLFAIFATRTLALVRLEKFDEAAEWASKAARRPNVHPHVMGTAAYSLALAGRIEEAHACAVAIRKRLPDYSIENYLRAFRLDSNGAALFRKGAKLVGMG
jgi:TolB-like protein/Tfp pilus assembly protein PilF